MLPIILLALLHDSALTPGAPMPALKGEFLTGQPAELPGSACGRVALLALGFTYDSRVAVEEWVGRWHPALSGSSIAVCARELRVKTSSTWSRFMAGTDPWKRRLGCQSPNAAYLMLLDPRGVVGWRHNGPMDEEAFAGLSCQTAALLN